MASQRVHLHCFNSTSGMVDGWCQEFPYCFFGFSNMVKSFYSVQREGLRGVPSDRILLETDGPYFNPTGYEMNAPHLFGIAATHVAWIRGQSMEEILWTTHQDVEGLYLRYVEDILSTCFSSGHSLKLKKSSNLSLYKNSLFLTKRQ